LKPEKFKKMKKVLVFSILILSFAEARLSAQISAAIITGSFNVVVLNQGITLLMNGIIHHPLHFLAPPVPTSFFLQIRLRVFILKQLKKRLQTIQRSDLSQQAQL
jgi:hypothetical protein